MVECAFYQHRRALLVIESFCSLISIMAHLFYFFLYFGACWVLFISLGHLGLVQFLLNSYWRFAL